MINYVVKLGEEIRVVPASGFVPKGTIGILPPEIARADWDVLQAVETFDETGQKQWSVSVNTSKKAEKQAKKQEKEDKQAAKQAKELAIKTKAEEVFPGIDAGELVLKAEMWRLMSAQAQKFTGMGLKTVEQVNAADGTELFDPGSALDTVKKIKDYADRKLELYEEFLVAKAQAEQVYEDAVSGA